MWSASSPRAASSFARAPSCLTVGTFLGGKIHVGLESHPGGRAGDPPSTQLGGASARIAIARRPLEDRHAAAHRRPQHRFLGAARAAQRRPAAGVFLSWEARVTHPRQLPCHITATNERTHDIIRAATARSPLFTGLIEGVGPRYCPSVEDKVVRFADKHSHQIFVEPEGLDTHEIYPNGISTSLPFDVQQEFVRTIAGFEHAHITRPGYAIEYDFFDPRDLKYSLESKYLRACISPARSTAPPATKRPRRKVCSPAINAARAVQGHDAWRPKRSEAYLGVLVDDLITRGATEPYRMFTSRAEYRLSLREDNADLRLTARAGNSDSSTMSAGSSSSASALRWRPKWIALEHAVVHPADVDAALLAKIGRAAVARDACLGSIAPSGTGLRRSDQHRPGRRPPIGAPMSACSNK